MGITMVILERILSDERSREEQAGGGADDG